MGKSEGDKDIEDPQYTDIAELTKGMKRLDNESFRLFFRLYYRRLWAYLFVFAKGRECDVEDAMQLAFTKIVKGIKVFDNENSFWAWLVVVTRNAYLDHQRKERGHYRKLELFHSSTDAPEDADATNYHLDDQKLDQALNRLDEEERYLINRKYFEGGSYRDIATELQETEKAIESRLARVRGKLRLILLEEN